MLEIISFLHIFSLVIFLVNEGKETNVSIRATNIMYLSQQDTLLTEKQKFSHPTVVFLLQSIQIVFLLKHLCNS